MLCCQDRFVRSVGARCILQCQNLDLPRKGRPGSYDRCTRVLWINRGAHLNVCAALRELQKNQHQNIIWVAPPFLPFAPALSREQIDVRRLTIVQTNNIQDSLWAAEQALLSECCSAVLLWTGNYNLSTRELRRLHLAAQKSKTWNVLLRHSDCLKQASAASLRLHLQTNSFSQLNIHVVKQPQGWAGQRCTLSLQPHYENWQRLNTSLLPQGNRAQTPSYESTSVIIIARTITKHRSPY